MLEFIGIVVVAYFAWKTISAIIVGGVRGHMMRSLDHAMSLGVPYDFAYSMIQDRRIMNMCRARMMSITKNFGAKDVYIQNGEILQMLYEGRLSEQENNKAKSGQLQSAIKPDSAAEIIPIEHRANVKLSNILELAEIRGVPREESLMILRNQREKVECLMKELDQLQGGVVATGKMGIYGWLEPDHIWKHNLVWAIETVYGEKYEDRSSDWGTDQGIYFLIQRAANNPDSMHRYPNLNYDTVCQFVERCGSDFFDWFERHGGVRFMCDIGDQYYDVTIRTMVPELKGNSGVKISAEKKGRSE